MCILGQINIAMELFLKKHTNTTLVFLAIVFLAIIVGYFVWGIGYIAVEVNETNASQAGAAAVSDFNTSGAAALDYRGLSTSTMAVVPAAAVPAAAVTSTATTTTATTTP
jgi:hypothetical protein